MRFSSLNHSPRSISRQRSEQNGRQGLSVDQGDLRPQVGQGTSGGLREPSLMTCVQITQQDSSKGTSSGVCVARSLVEAWRMKRTENRCRPPLISA